MATLHHKGQAPEPTTLEHVLTFLGIAGCVVYIFYLS